MHNARDDRLTMVATRIEELETRNPDQIDCPDEYSALQRMFWSLIDGECTDQEWNAFLALNPQMRKCAESDSDLGVR